MESWSNGVMTKTLSFSIGVLAFSDTPILSPRRRPYEPEASTPKQHTIFTGKAI
jgi:hypothetical protein